MPSPQFGGSPLTTKEDKHLIIADDEIEGLAELELSAIGEEEPCPPTTSLVFDTASGDMADAEEEMPWAREEPMEWTNAQVLVAEGDADESESFLPAEDDVEIVEDASSMFADAREEDSLNAAPDAASSEGDIEETMLISPDAVVRDHFGKPGEASARVERDENVGDNLPRDALANLIDIQKAMATLQALTKIDARGVPLKPRLSTVVESPVARPRSAGRVSTRPTQRLPQSRSQDDLFDSKPHATRESASKQFELVSRVVTESKTTSNSLEREEKQTVEPRDDHQANELRGEDFRYPRGFRAPSAKQPPRVASEHTRRRSEQLENMPQRRRRAVDRSADIDWIQVERQFQGIVRESEARQSQASSAEPAGSKQGAPVLQTLECDVDTIIGYADSATQELEPPIQMTVKPTAGTAVSRRNAFTGHRGDTTRSHADQESSVAQHSTPLGRSDSQREHSDLGDERRYPWTVVYAGYFLLVLGFIFGATGLLRAATTVRDTHDYHEALKTRISLFETSISESYDSVRKLEENYAVWSEYVRLLAEEDETHSLSLLETIQHEVERWQQEMQSDLAQFKQSLSVDVVEAALAQNVTIASDN